MPTYFAEAVANGEITSAKEFLLRCTRGMAFASEMEDEPLDVPTPMAFKPSSYWAKKYAELTKEKERYELFTLDMWREKMKSDWEKNVSRLKCILSGYQEENRRYKKMLVEVNRWEPPTDKHKELKAFAISQLYESMNPQTLLKLYEDDINAVPDFSDSGVEAFKNDTMNKLRDDIFEAESHVKDSQKRAEQSTLWMQQLAESLESL